MNTGEIAALLMAVAALITAIGNWRNGKDTAERLRKQIEEYKTERDYLREHNDYQDALILDRENKIDKLNTEAIQWRKQVDTMGRTINELWLGVGHLQTLAGIKPKATTHPLADQIERDD